MRKIMIGLLCFGALCYAAQPGKPCEYFESLLRFRLGDAEASAVLSTYPFHTYDDRNGYCAEEMDHGGMGYLFAVWNKTGGKVFGFSEPSRRDADSYDTTFWTYEHGRWIERKDIVPSITLEDFWDEHLKVPPELAAHAFFELELPRKGATVKVRLKGAYGLTREAAYDQMELNWSAVNGRFVKGARSRSR